MGAGGSIDGSSPITREDLETKLQSTIDLSINNDNDNNNNNTYSNDKLSSNEVLLLKLRANSLSVRFREHLEGESVRQTSPFQKTRKLSHTVLDDGCTDEQKILMLEKILDQDYMFTVLPREIRLKYARAFRPTRLGPNVTVFKQGDRPEKFYAIESGSFLVTVNKNQTRLVGAGQTFGELSMLYQCTRSATVTSTEESSVWYLDRVTFHKALDEIETLRRKKLSTYLENLNWHHEIHEPSLLSDDEDGNENEEKVDLLEQFSRRLVFHRFPPKSEIQCASQSSTIFHVVSGSISHHHHTTEEEKTTTNSKVVYSSSSSWFEVCRADEIARDGRCLISDSNSVTTVLAMSHMDLMSMSADSKYRRSIELDLEEDSDIPSFEAELSSSLRFMKQKMSRKFSSPETHVQSKINKRVLLHVDCTKHNNSLQQKSIHHDISMYNSFDDRSSNTPPVHKSSSSSSSSSSPPSGYDDDDEEEEDDDDDENSPRLIQRRKQVRLQSSMRSLPEDFIEEEEEEEEEDNNDEEMCMETRSLLVSTLSEHFLFSELQESELENMVRIMKKRSYKANECIIRQGERTSKIDCGLFIVGLNGDVVLYSEDDQDEKRLSAGHTFGASSLMFSERHRVTARTIRFSTLWFLGPREFHRYRALSASKRRVKIESFISKSKVLSVLPSGCVESLVDSFVTHSFLKGTTIIREQDEGDVCYFLEKGRVEISQNDKRIRVLTEGSFFGELALLNEEPRSATVTCLSDVSCLVISREAFQKLSASMSNVIKRAMSSPKIQRKSSFFTTDVFMPLNVDEDTSNTVSASSFDIKECIGEGSYGQVILVKHIETGMPYAVKRVPKRKKKRRKKKRKNSDPQKHSDDNSTSTSSSSSSDIPREVQILRLMNHHLVSRLVSTFDIGTTMFLVMPFYQGGDMFSMLLRRKKKQLTEKESRFYLAQIHIALMYLHKRNVIYRDLKLENVVLDIKGNIKLIDFGLAKIVSKGKRTFTICGTPEYMSPEMIKGKGYTYITDYWALGILLHEFLVGFPPFGTREGSFETGYYVVNKIVCKYTKDRAKIEHQSPHASSSSTGGGGGGGGRRGSMRSRRMKSILSLLPSVSKLRSREARDIIVQMLDPRAPLRLRGRALEAHPFFTKNSSGSSTKCSSSNRADSWWKRIRAMKVEPPWKPQAKSPFDNRNFDEFNFGSTSDFFRCVKK